MNATQAIKGKIEKSFVKSKPKKSKWKTLSYNRVLEKPWIKVKVENNKNMCANKIVSVREMKDRKFYEKIKVLDSKISFSDKK